MMTSPLSSSFGTKTLGWFGLSVWLTVLGWGLWWSSGKVYRPSQSYQDLLAPPPLVDLDTRFIEVVTLGHRGLYDDFITMWMLQILMDPEVKAIHAEDLQKSLLHVARHLPKVESFYLLSAFVLAFDLARPDLCEPILREGMRALPQGWRIPLTMGFLALHRLNNPALGATYYQIAADQPNAPPFIKGVFEKLGNKHQIVPSDLELTIESIMKSATDSTKKSKMSEVIKKRHDDSNTP